MQRLEVSCAVQPIYGSLRAKGLKYIIYSNSSCFLGQVIWKTLHKCMLTCTFGFWISSVIEIQYCVCWTHLQDYSWQTK
jgi:hypothetical protein